MVDVVASLCRRRSGDIFRDSILHFDDNPALVALNRDGLRVAAEEGTADELETMLDLLALCLQRKHKKASEIERVKRKVVNQRNSQGQTALMLACRAGAVGCVRLLLASGADPTLVDSQERTCLHSAAQGGAADVLEILLGDDTLVETAAGEQLLLCNAFVADPQGHRHRFIDGLSAEVLSPMHLAACRGHAAAVEVLLKRGAKPAVRCTVFSEEEGHWPPYSTPLHLAAANGHTGVAVALLRGWVRLPASSRGNDPRALDDLRGRRPVDVARATGHISLCHVLDPDLPLEQVLRPPSIIVPTLAALAAETLRQRLLSQLDALDARTVYESPCKGAGVQGGCCEAQAGAATPRHAQQAQQAQQGGVGEGQAGAQGAGPLLWPEGAPAAAAGAGSSSADAAAHPAAQEGMQNVEPPGSGGETEVLHWPQGAAPDLQPAGLAAPAPGAFPLAGSCSPAACGICLRRSSASSGHSGGSVHSGTAASSQCSDITCPICFDRWGRLRLVMAAGCGHRVCLVCARHLCEQTCKGREVHCPMCRGVVGGWAVANPREAGLGAAVSQGPASVQL